MPLLEREDIACFPLSLSPSSFLVLISFSSFLYFSVFPSRGRCSIKIPREPGPAGNVVGGAHVESSRGIEAEFRSKTRSGGGGVTRRRRDAFLNSLHSGHRGRREEDPGCSVRGRVGTSGVEHEKVHFARANIVYRMIIVRLVNKQRVESFALNLFGDASRWLYKFHWFELRRMFFKNHGCWINLKGSIGLEITVNMNVIRWETDEFLRMK